MSYNTILATAPLTTSGYHIKANGTTLGNSLIWDNGTNVGLSTVSPVSTNLVGSMTIVKSYNSDTPVSTTAQTYYTNQSNLYLFGRNAGLSIICPATSEEGSIFFGNSLSVAYASINTGSGTTSVGGDMVFRVGSNTERMRITSAGNVGIGTGSSVSAYGFFGVAGSVTISSLTGVVAGFSDAVNGTTRLYVQSGVNGINVDQNFVISTGGGVPTERMRITSGGQVQFRSYIDFLNGSTSKFIISRAQEILGGSSDDMTLFTQAGLAMQFWTAGGKRMNISSGGYINLNDVVYGNTVNTSPRTLYIENGTGALGGISSIRASKKNIENISNVDWLYQLNPVTFNYRKKDDEGNYTEEIHDYINYGLIAEDTAPIIDFIINYNEKEDGTKEMAGIEYPRLIIPLLKAIQEMNTKINEQNQTIQNLQEQINILAK